MSETPGKAVFLSYARDDASAARRIAEALRSSGVEVWFDENELRGGDEWDRKIRNQIDQCALFVAIISRHTETRAKGYFRLEWKLAVDQMQMMAAGVPFVAPVVIDETRETSAIVPSEFLRVQWTRLPGALPTPQFVEQVKRLLDAPRRPVLAGTRSVAGGFVSAAPRRLPLWAVGALAVVVLAPVGYFALRQPGIEVAAPKQAVADGKSPIVQVVDKSIAVLPFENLSDDKDNNAFFADGIHEDILTHLARIRELRVISRTSVMEYRGKAENLREIAKKLGVAYILEGSVRRAGNQVRITGQLIRASTDEHLWAKSYDRELTAKEVFGIQAELAQEIAASLKAAISPNEKSQLVRRPTENLAAYELYLQAREIFRKQTLQNKKREELLQAAVQLDPNFAAAWGELGALHVNSYWGNLAGLYDHTPARLTRAKSAIETALRLAPDDAEVMLAAARYHQFIDRDVKRAAQLRELAAQREPNNVDVIAALSWTRVLQGRWAEALVFSGLRGKLDPASVIAAQDFAGLLQAGRRYEDARTQLVRLRELMPDNFVRESQVAYLSFLADGSVAEFDQLLASWESKKAPRATEPHLVRALVRGQLVEYANLLEKLRPAKADSLRRMNNSSVRIAVWADIPVAAAMLNGLAAGREKINDLGELKMQLERESDNPLLWAAVATREALLGNQEAALAHAKRATELRPKEVDTIDGGILATVVAFVYAWTGDKDRALAEYARLLRTPYSGLNVHEMKVHPRYAPLRSDPRWEAMLNDPKNNAPLF